MANRSGTKLPAVPHPYIPPGPVEAAPYAGFCQPETRRAAFAAVFQGVEIGAYDERIVSWLVGWGDPTCRTIASLIWRRRLAGAAQLAARLDGLRCFLDAVWPTSTAPGSSRSSTPWPSSPTSAPSGQYPRRA